MKWLDNEENSNLSPDGNSIDIISKLIESLSKAENPRDAFSILTDSLLDVYDIRKGFLALREYEQFRFLAIALFSNGKVKKNLSLKLPQTSSLFEKVAESGHIYSENFAELYDGNLIEKQLLLDDYSRSFMLRPLKFEGEVVALLGYSSENPDAFVTFEEGLFDPVLDLFAERINQLQLVRH